MAAVSRRTFLTLGGIGGALVVTGGTGLIWDGLNNAAPVTASTGGAAFTEPPVLRSASGLLDVALTASRSRIVVGGTTVSAMTYNGSLPGPTLVVRPGDRVKITLANHLGEPTNLHTHGLHVSPEGSSDNVFRQVETATTADYEYQIPDDHPAGAFWYHPHHHGMTAEQVFAGLYGAILVERDDHIAVTRQRLLVISDITFDSAGEVAVTSQMDRMAGREGQIMLVNGQVAPVLDAKPGDFERWHVVNACTSRYLSLTLDGAILSLQGNDGSRLAAPRQVSTIDLVPGARADVLVTVPAGAVDLLADPVDRGSAGSMMVGAPRSTSMVTLARMRVSGEPAAVPQTATLAPPPLPLRDLRTETLTGSRTLTLAMGAAGMGMGGGGMMQFTIDGHTFDPNRVDQSVARGAIEEWMLVNTSTMDHPFHLHVWPMQLLATGGTTESEAVWRDVVNVPANSRVRVRIAFEDFTGTSVYHCHILDHEDGGMMGIIAVA
ncbi:multicopper oxidase family protein [Subtercola frigoramans]|uniref:Copper-containing nitrite reductase n=1 Tax=Subtercola frigoramans TaxID=120298 RepID=A0ABS2L2U4_9MICO|nr:multicopper oxidase family protein [Subtercola frigoramans]MBM7471216.1 FtsP/CotA-like multicopper oxidase with cupredoxin domain [Subtercola frigoramans]